ncbi:hypothetical protein [Nocardia flavorosea]|uniref:hypothetical protein n=1 Tax=Nocardia flavorosea TaxID=53429 RepID=UPI001B35087B|nr:hypothetical protein [Nocardia flavorosea]
MVTAPVSTRTSPAAPRNLACLRGDDQQDRADQLDRPDDETHIRVETPIREFLGIGGSEHCFRGPEFGSESYEEFSGHEPVVDAFLRAARTGQFATLLELLDPDVVLRADATVVAAGAAPEVVGSDPVARTFDGRARGARPALVDREPGAVWRVGGRPRFVFTFTVRQGKIVGIAMSGDPERIEAMDLCDR